MRLRQGAGILLALALVTALASAVIGVPVTGKHLGRDSEFALVALELMDEAWRSGQFWPRWLMGTNDGLGGTTFYSYPPLAFWVAAAVRRATELPVAVALAASIALWRGLFVLAAWAWLRRHVTPGAALAGAAIAALAPYMSVINPWLRFAYSETAAAALLPLLLIAIERAVDGRRAEGMPMLALAWAALAFTNLPVCVLAAHLLPLYALGYGGTRGLWRTVGGGAAGALLAACFLLPAIGLLPAANPAGLFNDSWEENLLLFSHLTDRMAMIWGAMLATLSVALWAGWGTWRQGRAGPGLARGLWALLLGGFALTSVLTLPLWAVLPPLAATEHPWRAANFIAVAAGGLVALGVARGFAMPRLALVGTAFGLSPFLFLAAMIAFGHPGWPRFLPAAERLEFAHNFSGAYSWEHVPRAAAEVGWVALTNGDPPPAERPELPAGVQVLRDGFLLPRAEGVVTLPQFHFVAWKAWSAAGPLPVHAGPTGFLQVEVGAPTVNVQVRILPTGWERAGWAVSAVAALGLLGSMVAFRRRRGAVAKVAVDEAA